jgi:two-component system NtrC family sensor kinase
MFDIFSHITLIYLLYLFYGAAFLFLGVSIAAKNMKGSDLKLADILWLLGTFGFLHGACEWLELGRLIEGKNLLFHQLVAEKIVGVLLALISFVFLLQFGISLIYKLDNKRTGWLRVIPPLLFLIWILHCWLYGIQSVSTVVDPIILLQQAEIGARHTFGFTGALLTAYGLFAYSREARQLSPSVSKKLSYAGCTFFFYAVFAGAISTRYFIPEVPIPIELLRGISACFITYFIVNALNIFDIETRKKIEQQSRRLVQSEKLASLGQLAAGIAHEINNPLTNASLGIQTLKKRFGSQSTGQDVVGKLDAVERNIDRASLIAQELLLFSRQREYTLIPENINTVIQSTLTLLQYKLKAVTVDKELGEIPKVMCDPGKLQQVFINVLSNSVEAMADSGTITISTATQGNMVIVKIRDTGIGVETENISKVFDPFFSTKEIGSGTGLGLYLCYGIICQHNGTIEIASEWGKGTEVTIRIPSGGTYEKNPDCR